MAADRPVAQSEHEGESQRGLLFRLSARTGAIVFAVVLAQALGNGMDPTLALIRALVALLTLTGCGWLAEQVVEQWRSDPPVAEQGVNPTPEAKPE